MAVGAPLLTEQDLVAVRALVGAQLAALSLGRAGGRCPDLGGDVALAVGLLPAGGGAVGLPALPHERPQAAWAPGVVSLNVTVIVTPRATGAHAAPAWLAGWRWGWA